MRRSAAALAAGILLAGVVPASGIGAGAGADPVPRSFTVAAAGDILIHQSIWQTADAHAPGYRTYDFTPLFRPIEPWIATADLAICHLEVPLSPDNSHISSYPRFSSPHELADAIAAAGYDTCSTASNHSLDQGVAGLRDTLDVLDAAGVRHTGTARSADERLPALYEVKGVVVGHLSYTYGTNGLTSSVDHSVNRIDRRAIVEDAAWARRQGAEFVIVSLHWGAEYVVRPTDSQASLAEDLLASPDVDVILGHHVHVVQPIDRIGDKIVVYGMSNQLSNIRGLSGGYRSGAEDGIVVHLEVTERPEGGFAVTEVAYTATWVHPSTKEIWPVAHARKIGWGSDAVLRASWNRTRTRVGLLGVTDVGPTPTPWPSLECRGRAATIWGTPAADEITGTAGDDVIAGRGGADVIRARGGDDRVCGGPGDDRLWGQRGNDRMVGGSGDDDLVGGPGHDVLVGRAGVDRLAGNMGDDRAFGGGGDDTGFGGRHDDLVVGGSGDDTLTGGGGHDALRGGAGTDTCRLGEETFRCES